MNHVWPPFRPDPYYGHRLALDYCSQTISWFYRPVWSLARVDFEAAEHRRLEDRVANTFVPFIGFHASEQWRRSPQRLAAELAITARYGRGHLVFCTLAEPMALADVRATLTRHSYSRRLSGRCRPFRGSPSQRARC